MSTSLRRALLCFAVSFLAGLAMVNSESLWIDEGQTLRFAQQPSFGAWVQAMQSSNKSEAQMPLSMFVAWVGGQTIGLSEWRLRAVNILWVTLAGLAVGLVARMLKNRAFLALFLVHPFVWYYANEARPYAMQICAGAWLLYVLVRVGSSAGATPADLWLLSAAAILGSGSSLLFAFPLAGVFVVLAWHGWHSRSRIQWQPRFWWPVAFTLAALGLLGVYFLFTLQRGAAGAKLWRVTPLNLVFCLYEALGFSGLGPPRHELRELARTPALLIHQLLQPRFFLGLGFLSMLYLLVAVRLWRLRRDPLVRRLVTLLLLGGSLIYAAATVVHFPFWGRHLAALCPFVVLLLALGVSPPPDAPNGWGRQTLAILLMAGLAISSLMVRFGADYRKDDYRSVSRLARQALSAGQVVWWSADPEETAAYYGLTQTNAPGRLFFCINPVVADIAAWPAPDLIFQSKPDIFDGRGTLSAYLEKHRYRITDRRPAFTVWAKPSADSTEATK